MFLIHAKRSYNCTIDVSMYLSVSIFMQRQQAVFPVAAKRY